MRGGFHLTKIWGIDIRIDPSWLLIFGFVTWNLMTALTRLHPGWSTALILSIAVVAALLFFGSVLAHELAHAVVALAQGIPVRNITLFLFGGVANIQREPPSPRAEFLITMVGPIASFGLGVLFLLLSGLVGGLAGSLNTPEIYLAQLDPYATVLTWLGTINIVLAIFNLIPGFPLDGGRVLRAALWAATGNLRTATRWASWVGRAVAFGFIAMGIATIFGMQFPFFGRGIIGGVWLMCIGWFLNNAALQSYRGVLVQDTLQALPVARLMRTNVSTILPATSVQTLVREGILKADEQTVPVVEAGHLVGLVDQADVWKVAGTARETTRVLDIMTPIQALVVAAPDEEAARVLDKLTRRDVDHIPVLQAGRFVGMLRVEQARTRDHCPTALTCASRLLGFCKRGTLGLGR